jgi:hypothetical protein
MREIYLEEIAVSANDLLLWMSARGQGSWSQFRAAVEELHIAEQANTAAVEEEESSARVGLPLHQSLRLNLERLAHAEFFAGAGGDDWRITPPTLSVTQRGDKWRAVLTGARSDQLLQRLNSTGGPVAIETIPLEDSPDQIRLLAGDASAFLDIAERTGMLLQSDAPLSLLLSLPPVDHAAVRESAELPLGSDWKIEQFSTTTLRWKIATRDAALTTAAGLFRFSLAYRSHVLLCLRGATYKIPSQVGKYFVLRRRRKKILTYDVLNQRLSVPAGCRPPFLVERALVLCSGLLPCYESRQSTVGLLHYSDIPETIARLSVALLRQNL